MEEAAVQVFAADEKERTLHFGKRVAIAVVQLIDRVQEVTIAAAGHAKHLLESVVRKEAYKTMSYCCCCCY